MYELIQGSIFDQKCDLVIIPCNDFGGITRTLVNDLIAYGLPISINLSNAGEISFENCPKHFTLSSTIGYAASVAVFKKKPQTTSQSIKTILKQIIRYCHENSLRIVNIPLLGAGAGRLTYEEAFQIIREEFKKEPYIKGNIFALSESVFKMLSENDPPAESNNDFHPRVFISYTGYDDTNKSWVKRLCIRLRENGVDARCDLFHLKLGQDLPQWMTNEIRLASKVLLICDKYYLSKTDPHRGGVGWETMIIQGDMLMNQDNNKFICIMREKGSEISLPTYMRTKYSLLCPEDVMEENKFHTLLMNIFDCDDIPPIAPIPDFIKNMLAK